MYSPDQYRALRDGAGVLDRPSRGCLRLTGADRRTFLQGLLTNDTVSLVPGTGCYAAYLTAQGRMIADMRVFETGDDMIVDLDASQAASIAGRWSQLVFSEDVEVANVTDLTAEVGLYGPAAARVAASVAGVVEGDLDRLPLHGNRRLGIALVVRSDECGVMGFDVIVPVDMKDETVQRAVEAGAIAIDPALADACRIEAGRPVFLVDMDDETIPLEAGIEDRAISLTKGCYVGQEIIIRVLHRGHGRVARRLVRLSFGEGAPVPARGDRILSGEREIGSVTSAAVSPSTGHPIALGYVHRDFAEAGKEVAVRHGDARLAGIVRV